MKLESLKNEKFTKLTIEQAKLINGGGETGYNRSKTGKSREYTETLSNGTVIKYTMYEYNLYKSDETDDKTGAVTKRIDHYGTNWSF